MAVSTRSWASVPGEGRVDRIELRRGADGPRRDGNCWYLHSLARMNRRDLIVERDTRRCTWACRPCRFASLRSPLPAGPPRSFVRHLSVDSASSQVTNQYWLTLK